MATAEEKAQVIKQFAKHQKDTGSAEVQVALITSRLNHLQEHFQTHKKDHHSRRGLLKLVGQRKRLLDYVKSNDVQLYRKLVSELELRK